MFRNIKKVLAIACVSMAVGAATIPSIVSAQSSTQNSVQNRAEKRRGDGGWQKLNLSDAQKSQMKSIRDSAKARRQSIFTDEQRAIMNQSRESGDRKGARKSLNLTADQKTQLQAIEQDTKTQMKNILTPQQQQQLEQMQQQRKANRGTMRQGVSR
jgi:Spy/CpxP family protein refolding chaperone